MLRAAVRPGLERIRILVVDDEPDICELIASVLTAHGAEADAVCSAAAARERLAHRPFDLLLTDINMPGEDGYALLRSIREQPSAHAGIVAAAVTARTSPRDRLEASSAGFDGVIAKPFDMATLLDAVIELSHRPRRDR